MFYDYSVLGQTKFVGLKNFVKAFHDRVFWISIKNSVIFVVVVPIIQILSILLAVLVNKKLPGIGIFRTLFYIPVVTSMVAVSIMWGFIFDTSGIINTALKEWKVISMPLGFLSDKNTAMICLMFITIWQGLGYYMMMYLAGLQGIPQELCEAATIDGANAVKVFTRIKLPMLKPYIWFCSLNSVISAIGVFDVVFVLTKGGPNDATATSSRAGASCAALASTWPSRRVILMPPTCPTAPRWPCRVPRSIWSRIPAGWPRL